MSPSRTETTGLLAPYREAKFEPHMGPFCSSSNGMGCQRQVIAVLLAIGGRQEDSDFHGGSQCAQAG